MKKTFGILLGILFYSITSNAQIQVKNGNETLYIEIGGGITDLKRLNDQQGNPTNTYSYRRSKQGINLTVRPYITVAGGSCVPNGYQAGQFDLKTSMVIGFYRDYLNFVWPVTTQAVDSVHLDKATGTTGFSGQIDFVRYYQAQHSLVIQINLIMFDFSTCATPSSRQLTFFLFPEGTVQEMAFTAQANASRSDQSFWKQGNCNVCNKKGVPGFSVSTVSLLPGFSDQDYGYSSLGPDMDFSRYFSNPGIMGMFGGGWNFVYEQELLASKKMVQYQNGTGANEVYFLRTDTTSPYTYNSQFSNRKRMLYYPAESRFEIFDPATKLFSDLLLYATENDTMRFHLSGIRDLNGNMVNVTYNSQQKVSAITDAAGRKTLFQYGTAGDRCSQMTLPDGRSCSYQYTAQGQLLQVTDIYANDVGFTYDTDGYITSMRVNQDKATFTYYTAMGSRFLTSVTNLDGNTTAYYPDLLATNMRWNRITDPSGIATIYEIDPATGSTLARKDVATGAKQQMSYNENKMLTELTLPSGDASQTVYDSLKRVKKTFDFRGIPSTFLYDSLDNMIEYTDAEAHSWQWTYNQQCRIIETRTPMGKTETFTYYPNGLVKTHTFGSSQTYTYAYDAFGNTTSVTYPNGGVGLYAYDEKGLRCTGYTNPMGKSTYFEYDALDRITKTTNPDGSTFKTIYDCCAPTGTIDENGNVTLIERTPLLQITKSTDAEGNAWNYTLDGAGRVIETSRPDYTKYKYTYNSIGKVSKETDPFNESVMMDYDLNGLLNKITDQSGNVTTFERSKNGNITSTAIGNYSVIYNRDSLDRVNTLINARGQILNYKYNADGFLKDRTSADINDQYIYDDLSRLSSVSNSASTMAFGYNERNSINQITYDGIQQFDFFYDLNDALVMTKNSDNSESILRRDSRGRVTSLIIGTDSAVFQYDSSSNLTSTIRSNGVKTLARRNKTNKIVSLRIFTQTDTLMKWDYTRNAMGYITREARSGNLCSDTVFIPSDTGGFYQHGNQLSKWHNLSYSYDPDGNLIQVNPGIFTAVYDNLNRLTEWTQDGGTIKAQYFYNAKGYVAKKTVQKGAASHIYHFFYDTENRVIEITQEGTSTGWNFFYNDNSLIACKTGADLYFYHYDHQGNIVALSDRSGNIVKTYAYDVWGKILKETGSLDQPFKYSGAWGVMHEYNYLYRMPYRFYDSFTGKFIQRDPSGFQDGVNLYRYAANNPLNYNDPSGQISTDEDAYEEEDYREKEREEKKDYDEKIANDQNFADQETARKYEGFGNTCDWLGYLLPGAKAGQAYAEGKPWYEVLLEAGKKIPGYELPSYILDILNKLGKVAKKTYDDEDYLNKLLPPSRDPMLWGF